MASPIKVIMLHPKKSLLFLGVANTALWYTFDYTVTNDIMRNSCKRAVRYGDERLKNPTANVRHITVILNPVAGNRKSKKLYTKWVEPLFHLAGIKVSLIETQSPNQAYDLMKIMSGCDGVAIVGGDGTVHEALNGLLHRPDNVKAVKEFPIGILPTGQYNSIARYINQGFFTYRNQKEFLIHSAMKIVDSSTQKYDVLKIEDSQVNKDVTESTDNTSQPIYALRDIRYGIYQDNFFKTSGIRLYQYYLKPIWLRIKRFTSSGNYLPPKIESLSFTKVCIGCSRCHERHKIRSQTPDDEVKQQSTNRRWWGAIAPLTKTNSGPTEEEKLEIELSKRDNPDCGKWISVGDTSKITDFRACMMGDKKVRLSIGRDREYTPIDVTETQDVRLRLSSELDKEYNLSKQSSQTHEDKPEKSDDKQNKAAKKGEETEKVTNFLVDGQPIQARSVEITAINKPVTIFTGPYKFVT